MSCIHPSQQRYQPFRHPRDDDDDDDDDCGGE
jgi:hypothetical protein